VIDINQAREARREKRALAESRRQKREKPDKEELSRRMTGKRSRKRMIYGFVALALVLLIGYSVFSLITLKMEAARAKQELGELKREKAALVEELKHVNSDEYIEQKAREELKMILPGETLYIISDGESDEKKD